MFNEYTKRIKNQESLKQLPYDMRRGERPVASFIGSRPGINPRMFQNAFGAEPSVSFLDEQASDQVLRILGNASPFLVWKLVPALLNAGEKQFLTGLTVLAPAPTAIGTTVPIEGRIAAEQDVHDHAEAPEIATFIVIISLADEGFDYLRRHKLCAAHRRQKLWCSHRTRQRVVELDT